MTEFDNAIPPEPDPEVVFPKDYEPVDLVIGPDSMGLLALRHYISAMGGSKSLSIHDGATGFDAETQTMSRTGHARAVLGNMLAAREANEELLGIRFRSFGIFRSSDRPGDIGSGDGADGDPANRLVGLADYYTDSTKAVLGTLAVGLAHRGRGLVKAAIELVESRIRSAGVPVLYYAAREGDDLDELGRLGFLAAPKTPDHESAGEEPVTWLRKSLIDE